jgi:hypothetical protein
MTGLRARSAFLAMPALAIAIATSTQTFAAPLFFQGFEANIDGWETPTRVASGTNGITSATGSFHAEAAGGAGDFTRWGGYNTSTGGSPGPFQPYTTSIDIFLNTSGGAGVANDTRFDFTSAINNLAGTHLRDFAFNVGFYSDDTGPGAGTDRFIVTASNNTGRANSFPKNPARDPFAISASGWYTFQHSFFDNGGALGVTLSILDPANTLLHSWLLGGDPITGVGGNRYGWFASNEFAFLAIDNTSLDGVASAVPLPGALPLFISGMGMMGLLAWRKKRKTPAGRATA